MSNINERLIQSLKIPSNKYKIYWDEKIVGFGIRITNNNARSFVLRYVIDGREKKYTIGKYPDLTSTAAREIAIKLRGEIIKGFDPLDNRKKAHNLPTIKEFAAEYIKLKENALRPTTVREYKRILDKNIIPKFGNYKITSITRKDVETFHNSLSDKGYMANRILQLLSSIFMTAQSWSLISSNPAENIKKFKEEKREEFLSDGQISSLIRILNQEQSQINASAIKLMLLTGSRKSEVLSARWQDFDLSRNMWIKPASLTKQNKISNIPLNAEAIKILRELKKGIISDKDLKEISGETMVSNSQYLFYNPKTKTHIQDIKRFWQSVCEKADLKNIRIHDLRHTFASILVNSGVGLEVIGKLIGHSNASTTQRYSHLINNTLKIATDIFGSKIKNMK